MTRAKRTSNKQNVYVAKEQFARASPFFHSTTSWKNANSLLGDVIRRRSREKIRRDFQRTATAVKMSLKKWIGALSILNDYSYSVVTLSNAVEELNSKFRKRKKILSSLVYHVYVLHETWQINRAFSRRSRAVRVKKCTKKCVVRCRVVVLLIKNPLLFLTFSLPSPSLDVKKGPYK